MLSLNLEGFKRNKYYLSDLLLKNSPQVIFLQEIWLPFYDKDALSSFYPNYTFTVATPDMFQHPEDQLSKPAHVWNGVAVGWKKDINGSINLISSTYNRIAGIKLSLSSGTLLLVSFYAPTAGQDEDYLESISYLSQYLETNLSADAQVIIGTDSNCSAKSTPRRRQSWKQFCESFNLKVSAALHPTFHHHNGTSNSTIDFFVHSEGLNIESLVQHCTLNNPLNLSSRDL